MTKHESRVPCGSWDRGWVCAHPAPAPVTGVKNPSGGGEETGKALVALNTPVLVSHSSCSFVGFVELLIPAQQQGSCSHLLICESSTVPSQLWAISYTRCSCEYLFAFASLSPDFKGEIFVQRRQKSAVMPDGGGCWSAVAGSQLYPSTELAAVFSQSLTFYPKMMGLFSHTDPSVGVWVFL